VAYCIETNNNNNKENICGNKLASQKVSDKKNNNSSDMQTSKENANDKLESVKTTKAKTIATTTTS